MIFPRFFLFYRLNVAQILRPGMISDTWGLSRWETVAIWAPSRIKIGKALRLCIGSRSGIVYLCPTDLNVPSDFDTSDFSAAM